MIKKYLKVNIVSLTGSVFKGEAEIVSLRGSVGEMGITYGHTELLSTVPAGVVNIKKDQDTSVFYVSGGLIEVTPSYVTIMVDDMQRAQDLNKAEAEKAKARAQEVLSNLNTASSLDIEMAQKRLKEADARLRALNSSRGLYYSKD